jgi:hypothetical protein
MAVLPRLQLLRIRAGTGRPGGPTHCSPIHQGEELAQGIVVLLADFEAHGGLRSVEP